jgi:uncharacterized UPF0160 family protein
MSEANDKEEDNNDKEFYESVSKAANFVNQRLHDFISPGGLNETVEENPDDDKSKS